MAVCGVYEQHLNPYFNMVEKTKSGFLQLSKPLKTRPRSRQESPIVYQLNGLYVYDTKIGRMNYPHETMRYNIYPLMTARKVVNQY